MKRLFKYTLLGTLWLLNLMLLPLSTVDANVGYIAFASYRGESRDIYIIDTDGQNLQNLTNTPDTGEFNPTFSPDGRFMAYHAYHNRNADIYVLDLETQARRRLTDHLSNDRAAAWSPDGKWIAFISDRHASYDIYKMSPNGNNLQRVTRTRNRNEYAPAWSPDNQWIAFFSVNQQEGNPDPRIYAVSPDKKQMRQLPNALRSGPTWSPTGDEIAFPTSRAAWTTHIYVMSADGDNVRQLTHGVNWHGEPAWSPNGRWIAYTSGEPVKGAAKRDLYLIDATGGAPRQLTTHPSGGRDPAWVPELFFSVSPSAEKMTTLWGKIKQE